MKENDNTVVIRIEDFVKQRNILLLNDRDVVYFICCNSSIIAEAISLIKGGNIVNKKFHLKEYKKLELQVKLGLEKIDIPKNYNVNFADEINFPIFCKENLHQGITIQLYTKNSFNKFFNRFSPADYYLEEPLDSVKGNEIKIYYIDGAVYYNNIYKIDEERIKEIAIKISEILDNIDVYSCDIIYNEKKYYVIDLNASAGFYQSDESRKAFIEFVSKK